MGLFDKIFNKNHSKNTQKSDMDTKINSPDHKSVPVVKPDVEPSPFEARMLYLQKQYDSFNSILKTIPLTPIVLSNEKIKRRTLSELDDITFGRITKKTNINTISKFVVVDVETSGLSVRDEILEVSAIKFKDFEPIEHFTSLIKPKKEINPEVTSINHISIDMLEDKPQIYEVLPSLQLFIGEDNLVGHNLMFDIKFLHVYGFDFSAKKRKYYDTFEVAKTLLKPPKYKYDHEYASYQIDDERDYDVYDYKLETLCDYYDIYRDNSHRASSDCLATGILMKKLIYDKIDL